MARFFAVLTFLFFTSFTCYAQEIEMEPKPLKIAFVAPLYIDSAFRNGTIKDNLPKNMSAGLEFIHGAEIALDTIQTHNRKIEAHFIDSRSAKKNLQWQFKHGGLDKMDLIIGGVKDPEYSELAGFAKEFEIPFISAIYPNDGGLRNDSFTVIMNSTLQSNVEGIFSYIVQKHGTEQILLIRQRNDNRIDDMFRRLNRVNGKNLLKINSISVDSINSGQLALLIDTLKPSVVIGATLNEWFALNTADACYPYRKTLTLIGMPNWEGFRDLYNQDRYKDFPVLFTTPHYDQEQNAFHEYFENEYFTRYRIKPGDGATKGFEATYYFTNILLHFEDAFMQHLNENQFACFHDFNFSPVSFNAAGTTDYFENKHVFVVQILNGLVSKVW